MKNLRARRLPQPHTMAHLIDETLCAGRLVLSSGAERIVRLLGQAGRGAGARNEDRDPDRLRPGNQPVSALRRAPAGYLPKTTNLAPAARHAQWRLKRRGSDAAHAGSTRSRARPSPGTAPPTFPGPTYHGTHRNSLYRSSI